MINKSVVLGCSPEEAFALFTERISEWWPVDRRHTSDPESQLFLAKSGRFWERGRDGREVELGQVRDWEAPHRLVLSFYVGTDTDHPTEVEVRFTPEAHGTRVAVTHRATPLSSELWNARAPRFERSWEVVLAALAAAVTTAHP